MPTSRRSRRRKSQRRYNKKYVPDALSPADRRKQIRSIRSHSISPRPRVQYRNRGSRWTRAFHRRYGENADIEYIARHLMHRAGINAILKRGRGAYVSSGSRPNQNIHSWSYARLHSVIMNGPARRVDRYIFDRFAKPKLLRKSQRLRGGQRQRLKIVLKKGKYPKKYTAVFSRDGNKIKTTHFGDVRYQDFRQHRNEKRKQRYLRRHRRNERWRDFMSAGALSRFLLWNKPTLAQSLASYKRRFGLV